MPLAAGTRLGVFERSSPLSGGAGWERSIAPAIPSSNARSRSRSFLRKWPSAQTAWPGYLFTSSIIRLPPSASVCQDRNSETSPS